MPALRLAAAAGEVGRAVEAVHRFALAEGLPRAAAEALAVAVDEAVSNVISHAYERSGQDALTVEATADAEAVEVVVLDRGQPFDPLERSPPPLVGGPEDRPVGGLGIHLMRTLVDGLDYRREGDCNRLVLRKARPLPLARSGGAREDGPGTAKA